MAHVTLYSKDGCGSCVRARTLLARKSVLFEEIQRELPREVLDRAGIEIDRRAVRICL